MDMMIQAKESVMSLVLYLFEVVEVSTKERRENASYISAILNGITTAKLIYFKILDNFFITNLKYPYYAIIDFFF